VDEEKDSPGRNPLFFLCRMTFFALLWLPYQLFCVCVFFYSLPGELREAQRFRRLPKQVDFCRLSDARMKLHMAAGLIRERRGWDGQEESGGRWPSFIGRCLCLIRESRSPFWKFGTLEELEMVPDGKLVEDIRRSPLGLLPESAIYIWAIHDRSSVFVAYNPFTKKIYRGMPEDASFIGDSPDPSDEHFVYAVSVKVDDVP